MEERRGDSGGGGGGGTVVLVQVELVVEERRSGEVLEKGRWCRRWLVAVEGEEEVVGVVELDGGGGGGWGCGVNQNRHSSDCIPGRQAEAHCHH